MPLVYFYLSARTFPPMVRPNSAIISRYNFALDSNNVETQRWLRAAKIYALNLSSLAKSISQCVRNFWINQKEIFLILIPNRRNQSKPSVQKSIFTLLSMTVDKWLWNALQSNVFPSLFFLLVCNLVGLQVAFTNQPVSQPLKKLIHPNSTKIRWKYGRPIMRGCQTVLEIRI